MIDGAKFALLRRNAKLTQKELADRMGVKIPIVQRAEWEVKDLSLPMAALAAHIMGCRVDDFLKPVNIG